MTGVQTCALPISPNLIAEYANTAGTRLGATAQGSGKQPGDPVRAAQAMIGITETPNPPSHLVLGAFGVDVVVQHLKATLAEIEAWRPTSEGADFPKT